MLRDAARCCVMIDRPRRQGAAVHYKLLENFMRVGALSKVIGVPRQIDLLDIRSAAWMDGSQTARIRT